jgi:hypothetical protein
MSLNKVGGGRENEKSKILRMSMPISNPNIKIAIDAELDNGWHISTTVYLPTVDAILMVFTKPKRN